MKPILYEPTATDFSNNGIGVLSDAVFCEVTEERNGILELILDYPINGLHFSEIKQRSIITAKPNPTADAQPFRVYRVTKPFNGTVTVFAQHISYDLSGIAVTPFSAGSAAAALQALKNNSVVENPFEFWTDKSTVAEMNVKMPASVRAMLGGVEGSVLDTYGGEYEWDGYTVKLYNERGKNRGVSIRYGKNLVDLEQEENCANVYTAVMPFWADSEGNSTMLEEKIVEVEGNFNFVRVLTLDLSGEFEEQPTQEQLRSRAQSYIKINKIGVPKISLKVSFVPLEQTEEYKNIALLERVNLCDTVNVEFEKLGVSATAKVIKTVYNVLLNRYESVELGDAKSNLADTIVQQEQAIKEAPKKAMSMVAQAAENATQLITGNRGGYVVIHSSTGQSQPDEILIMDKPTIEEAVKVWRWNNSGLGYSETGYSGTYTTAWTIDGAFNADFITAGTISANLIRSGLLQSLNGMSSFDMDSGQIKIHMNDDIYLVMDSDGIKFYQYEEKIGTLTNHIIDANYANFHRLNINDVEQKNVLRLNNSSAGGSIDILNREEESKINLGAFENGGYLYFFKKTEENVSEAIGAFKFDDNSGSVLEICDGNCTTTAQLKNKKGAGGQLELRNEEGKATFSFSNADGGGAQCWVGPGNGAMFKLFEYNDGINVHADSFHFWGKTSGLITGRLSNSACSAYIVFGQPTKGGYVSSIVIPSEIATGYTWQIADESNYLKFTMGSNGAATKTGGSANSGDIVGVYSIR
jgi:phage minor structural protein